jgi:hypothetical protein
MPTLRVGPNNTIQYVTSNGDVLSEVKFDPNTGSFRFVDGTDTPAPAEMGATSVPSIGVDGTGLTLEEDGGDLVYTDSNSNVVFRYNEDTGTWEMDSLSTDDLAIGPTRYLRHVENIDAGGSTADIDLSGILGNQIVEDKDVILVINWSDKGNQQDLHMRFNGDGPTTGDYVYTTEDGSTTDNADEIALLQSSANFGVGKLVISVAANYDPSMSVIEGSVRDDRTTVVAKRGSKDINEPVNSAQIIPTGTGGDLTIQVLERGRF